MKVDSRTYWLSFCDPDRPTGQRFLGVVVVDLTETEMEVARMKLQRDGLPTDDVAAWARAALDKAWATGCNPGGACAHTRLDDVPAGMLATIPRNRLMTRAELQLRGLIDNPEKNTRN